MSESYKAVEGDLVCKRSDSEDWYTIERAEHDGRTWMEMSVHDGVRCGSFMMSCRITDACVEGTGEEMIALAKAIEDGKASYHKRCQVYPHAGGFGLSSPRNSTYSATVPRDVALRLAASIRETVKL